MTLTTTLDILHFNDVYHVAPSKEEPVGGASRFATAIKEARAQVGHDPLLLFSGDAFNPSLEGSITRGTHITEVLNELNIDVACVGNHDFDFGVPQLRKLIGNCNFPWLCSNVMYADGSTPEPLKRWHILDDKKNSGLVIGVIGLVEEEWIQTIPSFPSDLLYHDFIQVGKELCDMLRDPEGPYKVDIVIALTHMRVPNDVKLASNCYDSIDLILGGHDHFYYVSKSIDIVGENWSREENLKDVGFDPEQHLKGDLPIRVMKSGTDFREFGLLHLVIDTDEKGKKYIQHMSAEHKLVTSQIEPDPNMEEIVTQVSKLVSSKTERSIGYTTIPLEGRSMKVRTQETNLGNLTADVMLATYSTLNPPAEIALCSGGSIRNDSVMDIGPITLGDIMTMFPFQDPMVVVRLTGQQIWDAMENSVSEFPKQEGRFPQVAGIRVEWSSQQPRGKRIKSILCVKHTPNQEYHRRKHSILPDQDELSAKYQPENMIPLDLEKEYVVVTRNYMTKGYDGYTALQVSSDKYIVDYENGVFMSTIYRKFFLGLKYINAFREHFVKQHQNDKKYNNDLDHHEEKARKEHVDLLVASIARHWRKEALKIQEHNHPLDGRTCGCPSSTDCQKYFSHQVEVRAKWHCLNDSIMDALEGAQLGHPSCIRSEDEEDAVESGESEKMYTWNDSNIVQQRQESWIKRWASICPIVQGRLIQLD
ncbi:Metallo-dependent phosphatase-like protein [Halteromyces radiatus]|uniref:Metallo-dependent phosphatase-like protein n=1 Tax=Halteromyces radiatus TaxID=101107 RepID=UPI002220B85C|nr:Metallo-dependent phosphatase-like protein [Halteromyces radiatus]KAI8088877.1 Metallo-dependent phosphatase-like protein [Halteromyces radiatus]